MLRTATKKHHVFVRVDDEELAAIRFLAERFGVNLPTALRIAAKMASDELARMPGGKAGGR